MSCMYACCHAETVLTKKRRKRQRPGKYQLLLKEYMNKDTLFFILGRIVSGIENKEDWFSRSQGNTRVSRRKMGLIITDATVE